MTYTATLSTPMTAMRPTHRVGGWSSSPDADTVAALCRGDEAAFEALIERYHRTLLRVAMLYIANPAVAEEVVQETWLGVLQAIHRFEGRCSLKTWIFRILANQAKARGVRERRCVPFSALWIADADAAEPSVDPTEFDVESRQWVAGPQSWKMIPEEQLLSQETRAHIQQAVGALPANQRTVISLRDIEGWTSEEVCQLLGISEANQRVLLHRARSKVRRALEQYIA